MHHLLGRLPHHRAVQPRTSCCATRASTATRSTGAGCATRAASPSRPSSSPDRVTTPLVRRGRRAGRDVVGRGHRAPRRRDPRRPSTRRAGVGRRARRRPRHQRGRVRLGAAGPEVIGTANVDAQLGDGLTPAVLRPAPGHHRRGLRGDDHRPARPRPQGGAAGPLPAGAGRGARSGAAASSSSARRTPGSRRYAWRSVRYEPGEQGDGRQRPSWPRPRSAEQLAPRRRSSSIVGRANLAEPERLDGRGARPALLAAAPGATRPAGAAAGQRRGRAGGRALPGRGRPGRGRHPRSRGRRAHRRASSCSAPTRCRLPRRRLARRALAGAGVVIAVDTLLTRVVPARRRRPAGGRVRREGRHHDEPRGPGHHARQKVTAPGGRPAGLDDRRRSGRRARRRPRLRLGRGACTSRWSPPCPASRRLVEPRWPRERDGVLLARPDWTRQPLARTSRRRRRAAPTTSGSS